MAFVVLLVATAMMIWFERKVISDMQSRIGPNRAGPWGLLQTLADGTKLIFKEDLLPEQADSFTFKLAPYLSVVPAFVDLRRGAGGRHHHGWAATPSSSRWPIRRSASCWCWPCRASPSTASCWPAGRRARSTRCSARCGPRPRSSPTRPRSGMTVVTVVLVSHSLSTRAIVAAQSNGFWNWNLIRLGFLPFIFFMIAITAELTRPPFDLTEADSELVGGFHTEYSSIRFGMFYLAEFMNTITMSAVVVTLFFGGPNGCIPPMPGATIYMPIIWFLLKTVAFCFIYVWFRAALPRLRYDQLMDLGWKRLIPMTPGLAAAGGRHRHLALARA